MIVSFCASQSARFSPSFSVPSCLAFAGVGLTRIASCHSRFAGNLDDWKKCSTVGYRFPSTTTGAGAKLENPRYSLGNFEKKRTGPFLSSSTTSASSSFWSTLKKAPGTTAAPGSTGFGTGTPRAEASLAEYVSLCSKVLSTA